MSSKYAILIGINGYHESLGRLKYCVNDVRRLSHVLTQGEDAFPKDRLLVLTDDGEQDKCPTYANIHSWLASYLAQAEDDDTVFVYFAGHGREHGGKAYLLPSDATLQTVHVTGIPVSYVQELLERCKARQKVLVLDACHSGAGRDVAAMSTGMLNELSGGKGIYTITSCDASELSHEWGEQKHGVFSYFLSEGLAGGCPPDTQNRMTAEGLYEWVYDRVRDWARKHRCTQTPKRFSAGSGAVVLSGFRRPVVCGESALLPAARATGDLDTVLEAWVEENDGQWTENAWQDFMLELYESGQAAGVSRRVLTTQRDRAKTQWLRAQEAAADLERQRAEEQRIAVKRESQAVELAAWRRVQMKPTKAACKRYLSIHEDGAHVSDVRAM